MEKERTIKELLIILTDEFKKPLPWNDKGEWNGICQCINYAEGLNGSEKARVTIYLRENKPRMRKGHLHGSYWWRTMTKAPRLKWLSKQIEKLK